MKIDGIIFDIDGTLWDVRDEIALALTREAHNQGHPEINFTLENLTSVFGVPPNEVADLFMPHLPPKERYKLMEDCGNHQIHLVESLDTDRTYPGVKDTIKKLAQQYPLFIVSNCPSGYVRAFMRRNKLSPWITDYEEQGHTGLPKEENIKLVMERSRLKSPIYIGDTKGDAESAKKAGISFVWASYGFGHVDNPEYSIDDFRELHRLLEQ